MKQQKITIHVVYAVGEINKAIRPMDFAHGTFEAETSEKLVDFFDRIGMPVSENHRITLPEWGRIYDDLSGAIKDYDIRNGDAVFITDKRYVCGY